MACVYIFELPVTLTLKKSVLENRVWSISPTLFEVGAQKVVVWIVDTTKGCRASCFVSWSL